MLTRIFSIIVAASLIAAAGALGYMATDRSSPIELIRTDVNTVRVRLGQDMERTFHFIQHKRCNIRSERALYDSNNVQYRLEPLEFPFGVGEVGEEQSYKIKVMVPEDMALGIARYESRTVYRCNPLHWIWPIYVPPNPAFFEVVP